MTTPAQRTGRAPWWRGARGEWYVAAQLALMALVFLGPRTGFGLPAWPVPWPAAGRLAGAALMIAGGALLAAGIVRLGRGLTPLPYPRTDADLVQTGAFAVVRHPMYAGGLILAFGWALLAGGWLTLGYVGLLFGLLDVKSRREEQWLIERYPEYAAYRRRVRKLIPFLY